MISDKVRPHHLERKALLYVRQSSAHQVLHNRESSALQYAMRDRLTALGWSEIEVIDDDLGRSAAGGVQRAGFERISAKADKISGSLGRRSSGQKIAGRRLDPAERLFDALADALTDGIAASCVRRPPNFGRWCSAPHAASLSSSAAH